MAMPCQGGQLEDWSQQQPSGLVLRGQARLLWAPCDVELI